MTWRAPEITRPGGSLVADEDDMLRGLLGWHRATLLHKCAGLTGEQLAVRPVPPSDLSLLGLIRHAAEVERMWLRRRFAGETVAGVYYKTPRDGSDLRDVEPERAEEDYARLVEEHRLADEAIAGAPLGATFTHEGETYSLRFVLLHLIGEYARHNGHADLLRERVDGATGG